jgi:hypothetical protein
MEELILAVVFDIDLTTKLLFSALEASENSLNDYTTALNLFEAPLHLEHAPVLLNAQRC